MMCVLYQSDIVPQVAFQVYNDSADKQELTGPIIFKHISVNLGSRCDQSTGFIYNPQN